MKSQQHYCAWPLLAAAASLCASLPSPALALSLSLEQALQLAARNAPSLSAQAAKLEAASSAAIAAGELPDPKLILGVQNLPTEGQDRWSLERDFMTMQVVGLMQEMPNSDKRQARVATAQAAIDSAAAQGRVERLRVRLATAQAWIASYTQQRKLAQFEAFNAENRLFAAAVRAQLAGGRGQASDVLAPLQEAALLDEQRDQLLQQSAQARAALKRWIGADASQTLTGSLPHWAITSGDYSQALQHHPELAAYGPQTLEAEAQVREALAEKSSDWSWEVDYQKRGRDFGDMVSLQLTFDLPLFPGSRQDPKIAARRAQVNQLEAEREALAREHGQQLEEDLAEYQRLERAVSRSQSTLLPLAEEKVRLTLASYRAGKSDLTGVIGARRERVEAKLKQLDLQGLRALTATRLQFNYGESNTAELNAGEQRL
ncbi:MAG: TolC family protein [Pseudomonas sp.]|uniref:TolC family protein n=1 Tax=Pseudomonas sp. TaxID=306 RepID=UPI002733A408|nr:TolC family protein [Pseudomonas sp.]MDP3845281.1 TolC family protein [Pseudomonas sp.]